MGHWLRNRNSLPVSSPHNRRQGSTRQRSPGAATGGVKRIGNWKWKQNPFLGTPELNGLKVMMVMINNWDIKDDNIVILASYEPTENDSLRYIISDLGGSFGKTGGVISRSRNKPSDYVEAKVIEKLDGEVINFN